MGDRKGRQDPTLGLVLEYDRTEGPKAVKLYNKTGRTALPWQAALLYDLLATDSSGKYVHSRFGYSVPRRNGKGEDLVMRELYGLAISERIMHTAHRTTTSHDAWERLCDTLDRLGVPYHSIKALGREEINVSYGGRIKFRTRTATGGLGEGVDLLVIDEAQEYRPDQESTLKYVVTDSQNPQTIMCGTPPTPVSSGTVFQDFRKTVLQGGSEGSGWAEWSVETFSDIYDRDLWYETNPSLGYTLTERNITDELADGEAARVDFNIQRLGLWIRYEQKSAIKEVEWRKAELDRVPKLEGRIGVGIKFAKDGTSAVLSAAAKTTDGKTFFEVVGRHSPRDGFDWILSWLVSVRKNLGAIYVDGDSFKSQFIEAAKDARAGKPEAPHVPDIVEANSRFESGVFDGSYVHMEQPSLRRVASNCEHRAIGSNGGFGYKPIYDGLDVTLLEAVALACLAVEKAPKGAQKISY